MMQLMYYGQLGLKDVRTGLH